MAAMFLIANYYSSNITYSSDYLQKQLLTAAVPMATMSTAMPMEAMHIAMPVVAISNYLFIAAITYSSNYS